MQCVVRLYMTSSHCMTPIDNEKWVFPSHSLTSRKRYLNLVLLKLAVFLSLCLSVNHSFPAMVLLCFPSFYRPDDLLSPLTVIHQNDEKHLDNNINNTNSEVKLTCSCWVDGGSTGRRAVWLNKGNMSHFTVQMENSHSNMQESGITIQTQTMWRSHETIILQFLQP